MGRSAVKPRSLALDNSEREEELSADDPLRQPLLFDQPNDTATPAAPPPTYEDARAVSGGSSNDPRRSSNATRILDRDAAFYQSRGRWRVQHISRDEARHRIEASTGNRHRLALTKLFYDNWFYSLAYQRTIVLMVILFMVYAGIVFIFAFVYLGASILGQQTQENDDGTISKLPFCDMDIHDHMEALYFSLSTMTTIGYGVSDYYFGGCWTPLLLVLCQVCCAITFDAVAVGLLFQRISRGHKRGKTIVFSNTACVQRVGGSLYVMFRVGELRRHQLRDASVRAYCVFHVRLPIAQHATSSPRESSQQRRIETTHFVTRSIKLLHEEAGSDVLMSLPQVIVHRLGDSTNKSPLCPPEVWYDERSNRHKRTNLIDREDLSSEELSRFYSDQQEETQAFLSDRRAEIVVLVEGTDELTGAVIQSRHSYAPRDLAWGHSFVPCVFPYSERNDLPSPGSRILASCRHQTAPVCIVDFAAFHDTVQAPEDSESSPYVY